MEKLTTTSSRLQRLVLALMMLTPCIIVLHAINGSWTQLLNTPQGITLAADQMTGLGLVAVLLLGLIKPVVYMVAFWFLYQLLGLYRQGIIFSAANVTAIRRIGWAVASIDIAAMLQTLITGPLLSYFNISSGYIAARLEVGMLIIGLFVVLTAYVMDMGRELKEQDSLVI